MPWEEGAGLWQGREDQLPPEAEHVQQKCVREGRVMVSYRAGLFGYSHWILCDVLHGDACEGQLLRT